MSRRRLFSNSINGGVSGVLRTDATYSVGDIMLYDKILGKKIVIDYTDTSSNAQEYSLSRYTPIGVVVVPTQHDLYESNETGVMSLVNMSCNTPDKGGSEDDTICFGHDTGADYTPTVYHGIIYTGKDNSLNQEVQGITNTSYLPSDNFTTLLNVYDRNTLYYYEDKYKSPSPYINVFGTTTNSFNTVYSTKVEGGNALSDIDGNITSAKLCDLAITQSTWKTDATITNNSDDGYSPSACCCWRYHTAGTNQGEWYLPSCAELGYVVCRLKDINATLAYIKEHTNIGFELNSKTVLLSCTSYTRTNIFVVSMKDGHVTYVPTNTNEYVRAFYRYLENQ